MSDLRFSDLPLSESLQGSLTEMGYEQPTAVQSAAIPMVLTGQDLMVQSQTGTGKTAAFGIPLIKRFEGQSRGIKSLILCPTRELASQVAAEMNLLGRKGQIQSVAVYGGASIEKQVAEMRFAHIIVGTPGRVLDHLKRRNLKLHRLEVLVLDEADEMLSMGFAQELSMIMEFVPKDRQTLLFSATIPEDIKRLAQRYMQEPESLSLIEENVGADSVEHHYYMVSGVGRPRDLIQVLEYEEPESALIFTNTRKDTEIVSRALQRHGYQAAYLNSDLPQKEREQLMKRVKEKSLRFLVATDIAARGIDISRLSHVVNYILPESPEVYIHRTGRTGRAGADGIAISLIGPREIGVYYYLKRIYKVALQERDVPTQAEIELRREERRTEALIEEIQGAVKQTGPEKSLRSQVMRVLERDDAAEVVSALLRYFRENKDRPSAPQAGGLLADVPKPERLAAGARAQTVKSVAERVSIVQSEFRGLPAQQQPNPKGRRRRRGRRQESPKVEIPKVEIAKVEEPKVEAPKLETPKVETPKVEEKTTPSNLARLFVNLGRRDGHRQAQVVDILAELGGLLPEDFQEVALRNRHAFLSVPREYAEDLIEAVDGESLKRKVLRIEFARDD